MASNTPIATVSAMSGEVFFRNSEGELIQLQLGDVLTEGDVLVPSEGAFVQLAMADGTYISFDQPVEVAITENMISGDEDNIAESESISDESVAAVLAAIEAGQDPTDVLPAPAAGGAGPSGGEGHDFVVLTRIIETTSPSTFGGQTFIASNSEFISPDLLPVDEAQPPVAVDDAISLDEDSSVVINILGNDSDPDGDLDPATVSIISQPSNGVISVDPVSGEVTYTPNENYNGPDSFEYIVSDEDGNTSNPATVSITVNPVNDAPIATDNDYNVNEGGQVSGNIISDDTGDGVDNDIDNDPLMIATINGQPVVFDQQDEAQIAVGDGILTINKDGSYTYQHNGEEPVETNFTYTVTDGGLESNSATVTLGVQQVNDAPVATDNDYNVNEGGQVVGNIITNNTGDGVDSDPENDTLTILDVNGQPVVFNPQGEAQFTVGDGTLTLNEDGTFTYDHDGSEPAPTSFTYSVSDGNLESNTATVTLGVQQVNDAPVATDNDYNVNEGGQVVGNIITNNTGDGVDSDPENDTLTILDVNGQPVVFNPQGEAQFTVGDGTLTLNEDGTFTYDHDGSEPAPTSFTYSVSDGNLESNTATVELSVQPVDEPVTLDMTGSAGEVYDVGILSGTDDSETTNGSFKVNAPDGLASVTIAGNILLVADLLVATELMPLTVFSDTNEEMVITGYDANTGTISYSYSLVTAVTHAFNSDQTMTSFEVTAKDSDGSVSDPGFIVITQNDDIPEIISVADGMGSNGTVTIVGALSVDPSADVPQAFSWGEFNPSTTLYANDEPISYSQDNSTQTITGMLPDNTVVFTLTVNDDMDTYTYTQYLPIQTEATDVVIGEGLSGGNSSNFRLSSTGLDTDPIQTIFYGYEFNGSEYVLSTVNTSANSMGVGDGQDIDSDNNQEDQLFMSFNQNVTEISLGIDTNGNSVATLRYTVYAVAPAELAMLGQDGFTYSDLPAGGIEGVVQVSNGDTLTLTAAQLGLDEFTFIVFESDEGAFKIIPDELTVDYLSENQDFSLTAPFNVIDSDFDSATDTINIDISGTLDTLTGTNADDALGGNEDANTLIGGGGDDTLTGGLSSDTFVWNFNDGGSPGAPAEDVITDFDTSLPGGDGDILDLSDLLVDEENNDLSDYLFFDLNNDGDTVIHISTVAGFDSGFSDGAVEQTIELSGVDLVTAFTDLNGTDQSALIQDLVSNGKLIVD